MLSETEQWLFDGRRSRSPQDRTAHGELIAEKNRVILLGETHATTENTELTFAFIKHPHERFWLRWLALVAGTCSAMGRERYLSAGDAERLAGYMASPRGPLAYTRERAALFRELRALDLRLDQTETGRSARRFSGVFGL